MKKLITTIAALALAVASYGQVNTLTGTLLENFNGSYSGNFYFNYPWNSGSFVYRFDGQDDNYNTTLTGNSRAYQLASGTTIGDTQDEYGFFATTPNSTFASGSFLTYMISPSNDNQAAANGLTLNSLTGSMKVTNYSSIDMPIQVSFTNDFLNTGGFGVWNNPTESNTSTYVVPANSTKYIVLNSVPTALNSFRFRVASFTGAAAIDDLRLGFALPTGITTLIEANNSTTVAGGGSLSFAIPSVTGSVEYANEIPFLSVSPSTLGTIDQTGAFTAGSNGGVVTITAASYGVSSTYVVTIPTVYITSSTIVGVTSLATSATSTYSISGITPSNAEAPTSTVWMSSNTAVATINATTGVLTGVSVGTTNVSAKHILSNNTTITSNAIAVNVFTYVTSATVSGAAALTVGGMATYSISGITPSNAQTPTTNVFKSSNTAVATIDGTSGALKAVGAGTTTVYALHTLSNNTVITSAGVTLVVSSVPGTVTGLSVGLSSSDFSVAPNPTTDAVSVSAPVAVSGLKVYSLTGVEVASSSTASVSLSGASAGVYILEISTANGSVFKRVIKE